MKHISAVLLAAGVACSACAPATAGSDPGPGTTAAARDTVPAGHGTLHQDEITVAIRSGNVLVKVTPLDEATIRLLAPDTYARLHALRESRSAEAARNMMRRPELFLVSFFSYEPNLSFQAEDVQLVYQSQLLRPESIVPLTTGWGQQRLEQQETQTAVYAFAGPFDYDQTFTVRYGNQESDDWRVILTRLERERGRILSRVR